MNGKIHDFDCAIFQFAKCLFTRGYLSFSPKFWLKMSGPGRPSHIQVNFWPSVEMSESILECSMLYLSNHKPSPSPTFLWLRFQSSPFLGGFIADESHITIQLLLGQRLAMATRKCHFVDEASHSLSCKMFGYCIYIYIYAYNVYIHI